MGRMRKSALRKPMQIIDDFLRHYFREIDYYAESARLVQAMLQSELTRRGIRAMVTSRAKDPERLRAKLLERNALREKKYSSLDEIYADIVDLAGARVAIYFPGDQDQVSDLVNDLFVLASPVKIFPDGNPKPRAKGLVGYLARHYRVQLKRDGLTPTQQRYADATIEVQVASVLMHAWAEVEHDLLYKPLQGKASPDEVAILDELNGMVLAGEIALERLQRSIQSRVSAEPDTRFSNEFELNAFLAEQLLSSPKREGGATVKLGLVDFLFQLLEDARLDTPAKLSPYLKEIDLAADSLTVSEQLIDIITSEDPQRYRLFVAAWKKIAEKYSHSGIDIFPPARQDAFASFMMKWIELEKRVVQLSGTSSKVLTQKVIAELRDKTNVDPFAISALQELRVLRNKVVHGLELPPPSELNMASETIRDLLESKLSTVGKSVKSQQ